MTVRSVAAILEQELVSTIKEWLRRVNLVSGLTNVPLTDSDRTRHLPELFDDVIYRLRGFTDAPPRGSFAATVHGEVRFEQGYSAAMLVQESRIFQVSTFHTLEMHRSELDLDQVLFDVITIADETDRQLTETVTSFTMAHDLDRVARLAP